MRNRNQSPYWLTARYDGRCSNRECDKAIKKGERVFYYPSTRSVFCDKEDCGGRESRFFESQKADEANCCW